jgi:hypothetical protein
MRDGVRDKVNVNIDHRLKRLFEDLHERHGKSWAEVLEEKVREVLIKVDPVEYLEFAIKEEDQKQDERRKALIRAKDNISILNTKELDQERSSKEKEEKLQKKRQEVFRKDLKVYNEQWKRGSGNVNWTRILDFGEFKDIDEAKEWLEKELKEKGIMEKYHHYT